MEKANLQGKQLLIQMTWRCEAVAKFHGIEGIYPDTQKTILDWLQQPVEEET